jgi:hypothetical protein
MCTGSFDPNAGETAAVMITRALSDKEPMNYIPEEQRRRCRMMPWADDIVCVHNDPDGDLGAA